MLLRMKRALAISLAALALLPATAPAFQLRMFQTPDGNIGCAMINGKGSGGGSVRCDIDGHSWKAPPKPAWCDVDWGFGLSVGKKKKATYLCAGDTVLHQGKVLPVGSVEKLGVFKCKSLQGAVRCVNRESGHGFFLSRTQAQRF
jgi:hypothetical protein